MYPQVQLSPPSKALHVTIWAVQILVAVLFAVTGLTKLVTPQAQLHSFLPWSSSVPLGLLRFIGSAEVMGAVGLLLPALTRVQTALIPVAATGLVLVMLLATGFHLLRGEISAAPVNLVLLLLAAFVAWGRWRVPIAPRT